MKKTKAAYIVLITLIVLLILPISALAAAPPPPTITLHEDTGVADNITNNGQIDLGGLETGATWEYSINSGANWIVGSGTSFILPDGTYNSSSIQARQTLSGEKSVPVSNTSTIIIAQNQIYNGDFQLGNTGFTTDYVYSTVPDIGETKCAVVTRSHDVHGAWTYALDHTYNSTSGKYFVANGALDPTKVVWQSTSAITVEANTAYRFEAYLMSLVSDSAGYPRVKFQIGDGVTWVNLGTTNVSWSTNEVGIWHVIYVDGKFNAAGTYYIRLLNDQTNQYNDLGVDDVYFGLRGASPSSSDPGTNPGSTPPVFDTSTLLSLSLADDTGYSSDDNITSNGQVNVSGLQYAWEYSTNGGASWTTGSSNSFTLTGDGAKSVTVHQRNSSNTAWMDASAPLAFVLDVTSPTVLITSGESSPTNAVPIPVTITFNESVTGFEVSDISCGNASPDGLNGTGDSYTADVTPISDGAVTVNIAAAATQDSAGNSSTAATQFSITSDTTAPTSASISINGGDAYSNSTSVTLTLAATGAAQMIVSENSGFSGASYEAYSTSKSFTMTSGDGVKTVYVIYKDIAGNETTPISDTIELDSADPTNTSISINDGDSYTNSTSVTLTLVATGAAQMIVSEDSGFAGASYEAYLTTKSFTLSSGDGTKTVYVKYKDAAGNETTPISDTIELDSTVPTSASISINGGDAYTNSTSVTLTLAATGAAQMIVSENSGFSGASYEAYSTSKSFTLSSGDDTKTVYVRYKDAAGNETDSEISDSIVLNTTQPSVSITSTESNPTNAVFIPIKFTFSESVTGFAIGDISVGNGSAGSFSGSGTTYTAQITPMADGTVTIDIAEAAAQDAAGNSSTTATQFSITSDTTPPTDTSIIINNGKTYTTSKYVTLTLTATGASEMMISEDSSFGETSYEAYSASKRFRLSSGYGTKTVYVRYKDEQGNATTIEISDSIRYTTVPTPDDEEDEPQPSQSPAPSPTTRPESQSGGGDIAENDSETGAGESQNGAENEPQSDSESGLGKITGFIIGSNSNPMSGILIELHSQPQQTYTDEEGYFEFENVELGQHTIYIIDDRLKAAYSTKVEFVQNDERTIMEEFEFDLADDGIPIDLQSATNIQIYFIVQENPATEGLNWLWLLTIPGAGLVVFFLVLWKRRRDNEQSNISY